MFPVAPQPERAQHCHTRKMLNRLRALRRQFDRAKRALGAERTAFYRSRPILPNVVLYESFAGNGMLCNPEVIFRRLLEDPSFAHLNHVWSISDAEAERAFRAEFDGNPQVSMVRRGSNEYHRALATSGYLINNATFAPQFGKRQGQIYLNTWHGTPLKHMGFDMPDGAWQSANTLRNFLNADFLLAANDFMADVMYEQAYKLTNVFAGEIITEGYPRIDRQWLDDDGKATLRALLADAGISLGDKRIVLYAPTWRGSDFNAAKKDISLLSERVRALQEAMGDDSIVLLKTHQIVHKAARTSADAPRNLVPNVIPTNALLGLADVLITDYSSIFFDFLATGRPIGFFTPDAEEYAEDRGTYFPLDELPGPVSADAATLGAALREPQQHPRYAEWVAKFVPYDDGSATERVIDIVFRGERNGRRVRRGRNDGRIPILFYLGGMRSNGITTSALNLLRSIDHTRYDVTTLAAHFNSKQPRANSAMIDPHVRQVQRQGAMNGSKVLQLRRHLDNRRLKSRAPRSERWHTSLWHAEWTRLLGGANFSWVADYSGYSAFWSNLVLYAPARRRAVWLHNEMASDRDRTVNGRKAHFRNLSLVFGLYESFDTLVSVSSTLTERNRDDLAAYAPADAFRTVRNLPNSARVEAGRAVPLTEAVRPHKTGAQRAWVTQLLDTSAERTWFINVGRLSPEKNQTRLIRAFAEVHTARPQARLLIVGTGPLRADLQHLIDQLGLRDVAFLTGSQNNPFAIMAASDCFVLSSRYEGQPMVLLEAALCNMPIVSTKFASIDDALPDDTIHVVEQEDAALRDGMLAFMDGKVARSTLDIPAYTAEVLAELDAVIATSTPTRPVRIPTTSSIRLPKS